MQKEVQKRNMQPKQPQDLSCFLRQQTHLNNQRLLTSLLCPTENNLPSKRQLKMGSTSRSCLLTVILCTPWPTTRPRSWRHHLKHEISACRSRRTSWKWPPRLTWGGEHIYPRDQTRGSPVPRKQEVHADLVPRSRSDKFDHVLNVSSQPDTIALGLPQLFMLGLLIKRTTGDKVLYNMREIACSKDYERLKENCKDVAQFSKSVAEMNELLIVYKMLATPENASWVRNWHQRENTGQLSMLDAGNYIWWPESIRKLSKPPKAAKTAENWVRTWKLAQTSQFNLYPEPHATIDELQLDITSPIFANISKSSCILAAIYFFSRFPSAIRTKSIIYFFLRG